MGEWRERGSRLSRLIGQKVDKSFEAIEDRGTDAEKFDNAIAEKNGDVRHALHAEREKIGMRQAIVAEIKSLEEDAQRLETQIEQKLDQVERATATFDALHQKAEAAKNAGDLDAAQEHLDAILELSDLIDDKILPSHAAAKRSLELIRERQDELREKLEQTTREIEEATAEVRQLQKEAKELEERKRETLSQMTRDQRTVTRLEREMGMADTKKDPTGRQLEDIENRRRQLREKAGSLEEMKGDANLNPTKNRQLESAEEKIESQLRRLGGTESRTAHDKARALLEKERPRRALGEAEEEAELKGTKASSKTKKTTEKKSADRGDLDR